jgi:RNA-directed DNA polymerase
MATSTLDWALVDWRKAERIRYRLQKRIYKAASRGNVKVVHNLQRKLMMSWSARMLAIRRVTQDNTGKKTAGVDGKKDLTAAERIDLEKEIKARRHKKRHLPVRRVWIPKPGKKEMRPLGIPTMRNRAEQAIAKEALEPEWEAKFEPNSYGFRPGRSCHDAIEAIFSNVRYMPKYVLDADIRGCFDNINHAALLEKLETYPGMRQYVRSCLKSGVMENMELSSTLEEKTAVKFSKAKKSQGKAAVRFTETSKGSPQGGVISPLLANIALHGLEDEIARGYVLSRPHPQVVRYADDFVVLCPSESTMIESRDRAVQWLNGIGLELKAEKTRLTHTLKRYGKNVGFDFLGQHIQQHAVGKYRSGKSTHGKVLGFKTIITPSREAQKRHHLKMKAIVRSSWNKSQSELITNLNKVNAGWARYHSTVVSKAIYSKMDNWLYTMLWNWARRKYPKKGKKARYAACWHRIEQRDVFCTPDRQVKLWYHASMKIQRHIKVAGTASPYDGRLAYWAKRNYEHPLTKSLNGLLLRRQQGKCAWCGYYFRDGEQVEIDHFVPKWLGGKDRLDNLQALHVHCHNRKTRQDSTDKLPWLAASNDNGPDD